MSKKYSLFIGRWQPWHAGHQWLIDQRLNEGKNVCIAISDVETEKNQPLSFHINKPYPNPFNPSTTIKFSLDYPQDVGLKVYGVSGNLVETLIKKK